MLVCEPEGVFTGLWAIFLEVNVQLFFSCFPTCAGRKSISEITCQIDMFSDLVSFLFPIFFSILSTCGGRKSTQTRLATEPPELSQVGFWPTCLRPPQVEKIKIKWGKYEKISLVWS